MLESIFRHLLNSIKSSLEIKCVGKTTTSLCDILVTNDSRKRIQTIEQKSMNLFQTISGANRYIIDSTRLKKPMRILQ